MSVEPNGRIGLLRRGLLGTAMVRRLLGQGLSVIAWDKNRNHSRTLAQRGASNRRYRRATSTELRTPMVA